MGKPTIIIVEDDVRYLRDLEEFLLGQVELPCTVHAINPCIKTMKPDEDDVAAAIRAVASDNTIVLLDNELCDYELGKYIAEQLVGMKIISISSFPTNYGQARFGAKRAMRNPEVQELLLTTIKKVLA